MSFAGISSSSSNSNNNNNNNNNNKQIRARRVGLELLQECGERLRQGDLVAFPTETVYGLGGNAMDEAACRKIFQAKERPLTDPLITHVTTAEAAHQLWAASATSIEGQLLRLLAQQFWPGPLTLVAKAAPQVPQLVMAGTGFVACRSPNHPTAQALIDAAGVPLAAPSANKFGHVSPTTADHVWHDLYGENVWILENPSGSSVTAREACQVGVESSVVKLEMVSANHARLTLLRQGAVSIHQLEHCIAEYGGFDASNVTVEVMSKFKNNVLETVSTVSPGQCIRHYSPHVPSYLISPKCCSMSLTLFDNEEQQQRRREVLKTTVIIDYGQQLVGWKEYAAAYRDLSHEGNSTLAAQKVFETLRWAEQLPNVTRIIFPDWDPPPDDALALAVKDRLTRAASGELLDSLLQLVDKAATAAAMTMNGDARNDNDLFLTVEPRKLLQQAQQQSSEAQAMVELDAYWRAWLDDRLAIDVDARRQKGRVVNQWRNDEFGDWFCYWDNSYGMPQDVARDYVFAPPLESARCGLIRPLEWDVAACHGTPYREIYDIMQRLLDIQFQGKRFRGGDCGDGDGDGDGGLYIHWGDESNGQWEPFMAPWETDRPLTPQNLLAGLNAHDQIQQSVLEKNDLTRPKDTNDFPNDNLSGWQRIQEFLNQYESFVVFYAGSELLNPVPCFAVARVRDDLVAGFIGGIVHT